MIGTVSTLGAYLPFRSSLPCLSEASWEPCFKDNVPFGRVTSAGPIRFVRGRGNRSRDRPPFPCSLPLLKQHPGRATRPSASNMMSSLLPDDSRSPRSRRRAEFRAVWTAFDAAACEPSPVSRSLLFLLEKSCCWCHNHANGPNKRV
jgi:hypothetical protein